jgi:hypothetical protein
MLLPCTLAMLPAIVLAAGIALTIMGRGRRVGDEPHCRKCGYNLTGLPSERCPECGRPATGRNVIIGTRQRRWRLLAPGLALLLLGLLGGSALLAAMARNIDPYQYAPTFLLEQQAKADDPRAIGELARRIAAVSVPAQRLAYLIPVGLTRHGQRSATASTTEWAEFLAALECAGQMTVQQTEQFHDQLVSFDIDFRRQVRQGELFMVFFKTATQGVASLKAECTIEDAVVGIGNLAEQTFHRAGTTDFSSGFGSTSLGMPVPITGLPPGTWPIRVRATKVFTHPDFTRDIDLERVLEILPADSPEPIRLLKDDKIGRQLRSAITIKSAEKRIGEPPEPGVAYLEMRVQGPIPVDLAFVLLLRVGEREVEVTHFTCKASTSANMYVMTQPSCRNQPDGKIVIPVLRSRLEVAKREPDIVEIWDGELVFPPVQLRVLAPTTSTAPSPAP